VKAKTDVRPETDVIVIMSGSIVNRQQPVPKKDGLDGTRKMKRGFFPILAFTAVAQRTLSLLFFVFL